jgi:hypothetical protein
VHYLPLLACLQDVQAALQRAKEASDAAAAAEAQRYAHLQAAKLQEAAQWQQQLQQVGGCAGQSYAEHGQKWCHTPVVSIVR